jgi:hypothetical protein
MDSPQFTEFFDAEGRPDGEALREALKKGFDYAFGGGRKTSHLSPEEKEALRIDYQRLMTAVQIIGAWRVTALEEALEEAFLRFDDHSDLGRSPFLESLQMMRGSRAGAAAMKYLEVKKQPSIRRQIYRDISLSAGNALTTLSSLLNESDDVQDGASIIQSMGRIPTSDAAQRLKGIYASCPQVEFRRAALIALTDLGMFRVADEARLRYELDGRRHFLARHILERKFNRETADEGLLSEGQCAELRGFVLLTFEDESEAIRSTVAFAAGAMGTLEAYRILETMIQYDPSAEIRQAARQTKQELDDLMRGIPSFPMGTK